MRCLIGILGPASLALTSAATAAPPVPNALIEALLSCRGRADEAARLSCYDQAAATLAQANSSGQIVVVDREDVRRTRRSLFGFSVPNLPFFSNDDSQDEQPDEIEGTIRAARSIGNGKWLIELEGGARWQTTEASPMSRDPAAGRSIKIKRGALGSYIVTVAGGRAVRAMRVG